MYKWLIGCLFCLGFRPRKTKQPRKIIMKTGKTLQALALELDRQQKTKKDYLADTGALSFSPTDKGIVLSGLNGNNYFLKDTAHEQIASSLNIPKKYYDRMLLDSPDLLAQNANHWFVKQPEKRLVRTLDGSVRAFLSKSYRPLDNFDMANTILPVLLDQGAEVISSELTDRRMYIKSIIPSLTREITGSVEKNDIVKAGIVISNSEIGLGSIRVEPLIYRLVCTNGLISNTAMRKYHVGKSNEFENVQEYFSNETRQLDDRAFWMKVKDIVLTAFNRDIFDSLVEKISATTANQISTGALDKVVEITTKKLSIVNEKSKSSILKHLIEGRDLSQWGLANAITRTANDCENYEHATELERSGGAVIELPKTEWEEISRAA